MELASDTAVSLSVCTRLSQLRGRALYIYCMDSEY